MSKKTSIFNFFSSIFEETLSSKAFDEFLPTKVFLFNDEENKKIRASLKNKSNYQLVGECFTTNVQEEVTRLSILLGYKNRPISVHSLTNKNFKGPKTEKQLEVSRRSYKGSIKNPKVGITWGHMAREFPEFYSEIMKRVAVILKEQGHFERIGKLGAYATHQKLREEGRFEEHMKYMASFITPEVRKRITEAFVKAGREYAKTPEAREKCRQMGQKWGSINGQFGMKAIHSSPKQREWSSSGGLAGGAKKAIEKGTHNFLSQSPNKKLVLCPDGMVSSAPSAVLYCKAKKLNVDKIVDMPENYLHDLDSKILELLNTRGELGFKQIEKELEVYPLHLVKNRVNLLLEKKIVNAVGNTINRKFYTA